MGLLSKMFPPRPVQIVLTGEIVEPKPGQVLVLTTPFVPSPAQIEAAKAAIESRFGSMDLIFVMCGGSSLSVKDAEP